VTSYANTDNQLANEQAHLEEVYFVEMDLPSGWLRLHTRSGTLSCRGSPYTGVGQFGELGDIDEDAMLRPSGVTVTLSGVDSSVITAAKEVGITVPIVVRLEGTNVALGKQMLKDSGLALIPADDLSDAAAKIVAAVK
jgi:hypothetical protein